MRQNDIKLKYLFIDILMFETMAANGAVVLFALIAFAIAQFHQDIYDIEHDRIDILKYNKSFVRRPDFKVLYYNESTKMKALNASGFFTSSIERSMRIDVTVYRFVNNAYRVFPINITLEGCSENKKDVFGLQTIYDHTNFKGCPVPPGYLYLKYYLLQQDKFPPQIPFGKYKVFVDIHADGSSLIGNGNWFGAIVPKKRN